MKKVFGALASRAGRVNWVAHECGLAYEHVHVPVGVPAEEKPTEFLMINPAGTMPVYQDGDYTLKESWAIDLYLARKYQPSLMGSTIEEEGLVYQWTFFTANDLEVAALATINNSGFDKDHPLDEEKFAEGKKRFYNLLATVDSALEGKEYLVGNTFTLADLHVACMIAFPVVSSIPRDEYKNISAWLKRCTDRPAYDKFLPEEMLSMVKG